MVWWFPLTKIYLIFIKKMFFFSNFLKRNIKWSNNICNFWFGQWYFVVVVVWDLCGIWEYLSGVSSHIKKHNSPGELMSVCTFYLVHEWIIKLYCTTGNHGMLYSTQYDGLLCVLWFALWIWIDDPIGSNLLNAT